LAGGSEATVGTTFASVTPIFHSVMKKGHDSAVFESGHCFAGACGEGQQGSEECWDGAGNRKGQGNRLLAVTKATNSAATPHT
jgi:hypothetical protein